MNNSFARFLIAGAANTIVTYALFLVLNRFLHHAVAYTIVFLIGIALAYLLASEFVFKTGVAVRSAMLFPGVYVVQYIYGLALLTLLVDGLGLGPQLAVLLIIVTSIPLTYLLSKYVVTPWGGTRSFCKPNAAGAKDDLGHPGR